MKPWDLPTEFEERLWEWAFFFKDRSRLKSCASAEGRYQRHSDDADPEGWGDEDAAPRVQPSRSYRLPRALETHEIIQTLDKKYKWALTYGYCFPSLPRFVILRLMKKYTGVNLTWTRYLDVLDIGRMRVYSNIHKNLLTPATS